MQLVFPQDLEDILKIINVLRLCLTFHHHIVYINLDVSPQLWLKYPSHHPLVGSPCTLQTKGHYFVMVISNRSDKSCLLLIV